MLQLKNLRKRDKITQEDLAKYMGITQPTLSGWESEKFQIDNASLKKLASYFNVSIDYLLGNNQSTCACIISESCIICCADILTTKDFIDKMDPLFSDNISALYKKALDIANKIFHTDKSFFESRIMFRAFSDNFIFAIKYNQSSFKDNFKIFSNFISVFQLTAFLNYGFLIRGGIDEGKLTFNDTCISGEGVFKAYKIKRESSVFPRILLSDSVLELLSSGSQSDLKGCIIEKDFDNNYFLDYIKNFDTVIPLTSRYEHDSFYILNSMLEARMSEKREAVLEKYDWTINYLYNYCSKKNNSGGLKLSNIFSTHLNAINNKIQLDNIITSIMQLNSRQRKEVRSFIDTLINDDASSNIQIAAFSGKELKATNTIDKEIDIGRRLEDK